MFNAHSHLLGNDQRFALLLLFSATAAAAILPFAAWRFFHGQWLAGVLDTAIVIGFSTAIWYAWRNRRIEAVALSIAVLVSCSIVVVTPFTGSHARRHQTRSSVAVLDLDHFKAINDTHGHEAGDQVLKSLVGLCRQALRNDDQIYRMGGEEFVLLVPGMDEPALMQALERLQAHLRPRLESPAGPVTVSIGAAMLEQDDADWSDWLARADQALYKAKDAGRDQVRVASSSASVSFPRRRASDVPQQQLPASASAAAPPATGPQGNSPKCVVLSPVTRKCAE